MNQHTHLPAIVLALTACGVSVTGCSAELDDAELEAAEEKVASTQQPLLFSEDHLKPRQIHAGGRCLDVKGGDPNNGANVILWNCHDGPNQTWTFTVTHELTGPGGKCLDIPGHDTSNGTRLIMHDCLGGDNQKWLIRPSGNIISFADSTKCLEVAGPGSDGYEYLVLNDCSAIPRQRFGVYKFDEIVKWEPPPGISSYATYPFFYGVESDAFDCINFLVAGFGTVRDWYPNGDISTEYLGNEVEEVSVSSCSAYGFSVTDGALDAVKAQLGREIRYVSLLREHVENAKIYTLAIRDAYDGRLAKVKHMLDASPGANFAVQFSLAFLNGLGAVSALNGWLAAPICTVTGIMELHKLSSNGGDEITLQDSYANMQNRLNSEFEGMMDELDASHDHVVASWGKLEAMHAYLTTWGGEWPSNEERPGQITAAAHEFERELWKRMLGTTYRLDKYDTVPSSSTTDGSDRWYFNQTDKCTKFYQSCRINSMVTTLVRKGSWPNNHFVNSSLCEYLWNDMKFSKDDLFNRRNDWAGFPRKTYGEHPCPHEML